MPRGTSVCARQIPTRNCRLLWLWAALHLFLLALGFPSWRCLPGREGFSVEPYSSYQQNATVHLMASFPRPHLLHSALSITTHPLLEDWPCDRHLSHGSLTHARQPLANTPVIKGVSCVFRPFVYSYVFIYPRQLPHCHVPLLSELCGQHGREKPYGILHSLLSLTMWPPAGHCGSCKCYINVTKRASLSGAFRE